MKKLLSLLTITTLTASIPAPLLANTTLTRAKRDVGVSNSNNDYLPLKEINSILKNIFYPAIDSKDNIYFVLSDKLFVLKQGETTPTLIKLFLIMFNKDKQINIGLSMLNLKLHHEIIIYK